MYMTWAPNDITNDFNVKGIYNEACVKPFKSLKGYFLI